MGQMHQKQSPVPLENNVEAAFIAWPLGPDTLQLASFCCCHLHIAHT